MSRVAQLLASPSGMTAGRVASIAVIVASCAAIAAFGRNPEFIGWLSPSGIPTTLLVFMSAVSVSRWVPRRDATGYWLALALGVGIGLTYGVVVGPLYAAPFAAAGASGGLLGVWLKRRAGSRNAVPN